MGSGSRRPAWVEFFHRQARPIAFGCLILALVMIVGSIVVWVLAIVTGWINSTAFVSHVSMAALLFAGLSGIGAVAAAVLALFPGNEDLSVPESTDPPAAS